MIRVAVAAGGAAWESELLPRLAADADLELVRRCVDVADLLALAATGAVQVAVVDAGVGGGIDVDAVHRLGRHGVAVIGVGAAEQAAAWGIERSALPADVVEAIRSVPTTVPTSGPTTDRGDVVNPSVTDGAREAGRLIVVWGPPGAPGRSTVALSLAQSLTIESERAVVLVDADVYGGSLAQALGLLDDVSGIAAACRAANQGADQVQEHLVAIAPGLHLLSGLPAGHMWRQVRAPALDRVLDRLLALADLVVVDAAFCVEPSETGGRGRNDVTTRLLERADDVVVVGRADPVGLGRLVRGVHELEERGLGAVQLVLNRSRRSVGWSEQEVLQTVSRLTGRVPVAVVPDDASLIDAALMSGRLPRDVAAQSEFIAAVDGLAAHLVAPVTL